MIAPAHFVERHGLVVIVAIGESVVAIGFGASQLPVDGSLVAVAVVGLALSACLWWLYFGGDDERAEHALGALPQFERAQAAVRAFGHWHLPMLLGIITIAAVSREATAHPFSSLTWARAAMLGGGVAAYLAGRRRVPRTARHRPRALANGRGSAVARRHTDRGGSVAVRRDGRPGRAALGRHRPRREGRPRSRALTPTPEGEEMATVTAHIIVREAGRAADWYESALGACSATGSRFPTGATCRSSFASVTRRS